MKVRDVYWHSTRPLVLVVMEAEHGHALVWLRLNASGAPVPVEVTVRPNDAPSDRRCREMLRDFRSPRTGSVSTSMIRSLSLADALNAVAENAWEPESFYNRVTRADMGLVMTAYDRFRSTRDRAAAIEWVNVAAAFVSRVQTGDPSPVKSLAHDLGKTTSWVTKRLTSARLAGYLTSYGHGVVGGDLTPEAIALLQRVAMDEAIEEADGQLGAAAPGDPVGPSGGPTQYADRVEMCMWCMQPFVQDGQQAECPNCGHDLR